MKCKDLETSSSGRFVTNKKTDESIYSIFDLIDSQWCTNCSSATSCKILEILESQVTIN